MSYERVKDVKTLRETYPEPKGSPVDKVLYELDEHCRSFIARSPFLVLGTVGDVSPKGDHPGFVSVLDNKTLLIPDRRGNNRLDSFQNIVANPTVSLIFLIPGVNETFRIRGDGEITMDSELLEPLALNGKVPQAGLIVHVREAYLHCGKAVLRSKLWETNSNTRQKEFSGRDMLADHVGRDRKEFQEYYDENLQAAMTDEGR